MFPNETRGRQERLRKLIFELSENLLSEDETKIKQILNRLKEIYKDNFKHKYSDFFPIILEIFKEDNEYNIEYLSNNLDKLGTYLEQEYAEGKQEYYDNIYSQFIKLCDHLNLQISQLNYFSVTEKKTNDSSIQLQEVNQKLEESYKKLNESNLRLEDSYDKMEDANKKASTLQTELISILSIFAAIIIAFSGGLTLLGSCISSISNAKHYESVTLIAIICGIVMFNTIFLMMFFVSKLTERDIFAKCKTKNCVECDNLKCKGMSKIRKRLPYVFYFNCMAIVGIVIDMLVWFLDVKGCFR